MVYWRVFLSKKPGFKSEYKYNHMLRFQASLNNKCKLFSLKIILILPVVRFQNHILLHENGVEHYAWD